MKFNFVKIFRLFLPLFLLTISHGSVAQENWQLSEKSSITIAGTSNLHDWISEVQKWNGTAEMLFGEDGNIDFQNLMVAIPVTSIKSSKGAIMDKKTHNALDSEKHPNIEFSLIALDEIEKTLTGFNIMATCNLTIAGTTNRILLEVKAREISNEEWVFEGTKLLRMTDFNVAPPTALMGALKTGDQVTIAFKMILQK